jgi:hypothetical protein
MKGACLKAYHTQHNAPGSKGVSDNCHRVRSVGASVEAMGLKRQMEFVNNIVSENSVSQNEANTGVRTCPK